MDILTKWLKITNQYNCNNEEKKPSHLLLNSGKLYVNNENIDIFYEKYTTSILNGDYHYIVECRKDIFRLFFDLDFLIRETDEKTNVEKNEEIFNEFIKIINDTIYDFYDAYYLCIVTTADIKKVKKIYKNDDNPENAVSKIFLKKGFHLHFPGISTNKTIALEIRKACIRNIKKSNKFDDIFENTVEDIIDESVFKNSGLRLTGSRKGSYISQTKEFVDEGRPYNLLLVFKNNEIDIDEYNELSKNMLLLINKTSILSREQYVLNIKNNPNLECQNCENENENEYSNSLENINNSYDNPGTWKRLQIDDIRYTEIIEYFKIHMPRYSSKDIKRIFYSDNESVYILCSQSKYCTNIGKNHNSEHIYFKLTKEGISQRCFCRCDTLSGRKYGYCKDYGSNAVPCSNKLIKYLNFKESQISKNNKQALFVNENLKENKSSVIDNFATNLFNQFTNNFELVNNKQTKKTSRNK